VKYFLSICFLFVVSGLRAQYVYTIKADSVKITNCDSAELIIENHTQGIPGFLFNTGNGRTQFKRGLISLGNGSYQIGADTLKAWVQGGNSWGTAGVFGTLDNNPVNFYSNNAQRMSLLGSGRLLVNKTTDDGHDILQITGNVCDSGYIINSSTQLGTGTTGGSIRLRPGTAADGAYMSFYKAGNTNQRAMVAEFHENGPLILFDSIGISLYNTPYLNMGGETPENATLSISTPYGSSRYDFIAGRATADSFDYDMSIITPGTVVFGAFEDLGCKTRINGSALIAGNVGIGIYSPTAQLHTTGSVRFAGLTVDSALNNVVVCDANGNLYTRSASSLASADFPRSSLAVNGTIKAQNLTLHPPGWADYVFDSSYRLPTLSDLEIYIRREHHLPGMPSTAAVQAHGVDVGETQTALLKKIEEITLYSIKQDRRIQEQDQQIELLKKEMGEMKKMIMTKATN
jgi:hypothetical protein